MNLTRGFHKFRGEYIEYSGDAYVRIIPFDNDIGVSDTIVFRLDNHVIKPLYLELTITVSPNTLQTFHLHSKTPYIRPRIRMIGMRV